VGEIEIERADVCGGITVSSGVKRLVAVLLVHPLFSAVPPVFSMPHWRHFRLDAFGSWSYIAFAVRAARRLKTQGLSWRTRPCDLKKSRHRQCFD
jgi:hypothetical protein